MEPEGLLAVTSKHGSFVVFVAFEGISSLRKMDSTIGSFNIHREVHPPVNRTVQVEAAGSVKRKFVSTHLHALC
jgi:hypothetical protein